MNKRKQKLKALKFKLMPPDERMKQLLDEQLGVEDRVRSSVKTETKNQVDMTFEERLKKINEDISKTETKESVGQIKKNLEMQLISLKKLAEDFDRGAKLQLENVRTSLDQKVQRATQNFADSLKEASRVIDGLKNDHGGLAKNYSQDKEVLSGRISNAEGELQKVWAEFKRLIFYLDQISQPQGTTRVMIFLAGVDLGSAV